MERLTENQKRAFVEMATSMFRTLFYLGSSIVLGMDPFGKKGMRFPFVRLVSAGGEAAFEFRDLASFLREEAVFPCEKVHLPDKVVLFLVREEELVRGRVEEAQAAVVRRRCGERGPSTRRRAFHRIW